MPRTAGSELRVAYLINQYPKVSHTFIRREIQEVERSGVEVERIALRGWDADVVDAQDLSERERTRYVLKDGLWPLAGAVVSTLLRRPRAFGRAAMAALAMSRNAVRPLPYHLVYLAHACRIREWLEHRQVSHLHAHFGTNTAEVARLVRILGGPPYSFTAHGADEADNALQLHLDAKVRDADFVVAVSAYTRAQLMRHTAPPDWAKIKQVHCGLDEDFYDAPRRDLQSAQGFVCVGRLSAEKGHLILIEAFRQVVDRYPDATLVLIGDGELRPSIEAMIRDLNLQRSVRITGWLDSAGVRAEILSARALVQPSLQEGLPVVIMEAMALGRPVISTYVAGIPELVRPGENGWLTPAGTAGGLVACFMECIDTPIDKLRGMGEAARSRARARHSIRSEAAKLVHLFAQSAAARAPCPNEVRAERGYP